MSRLLVVGNPGREHVGSHIMAGAAELGISARILNIRMAWVGPLWLRRISWHLAAKRPTALGRFSRSVLHEAKAFQPEAVLCTGIEPELFALHAAINRPLVQPLSAKGTAKFFAETVKERFGL